MEKPYDRLVNYAESLVKIYMEDYDEADSVSNEVALYSVLVGSGPNKVEYNGGGHNYRAVVDGVHLYYRDTKDERMPTLYNDTLGFLTKYSSTPELVQMSYDIIGYELEKEKQGTASFKADVLPALKQLSETIDANYSKLSMSKINFSGWRESMDKNLKDKYGDMLK